MPYTVDWSRSAENQLASVWTLAANRNSVTRAEHRITQILEADPTVGTHLAEGLWSLRVAPLTVYYEINAVDVIVTVTAVAIS